MLAHDPDTCVHGLPLNAQPPCFFCSRQPRTVAETLRTIPEHRNPPAAESRSFPKRKDSQRKGGAATHRKAAWKAGDAPPAEPLEIMIVDDPEPPRPTPALAADLPAPSPRQERYARLTAAVQRVEGMQASLSQLLHDLRALQNEVAACRGLSRVQAAVLEELQEYMRRLGEGRPVPLVEIFPHTAIGDRNRTIVKRLACQGVLESVGLGLRDGAVVVKGPEKPNE